MKKAKDIALAVLCLCLPLALLPSCGNRVLTGPEKAVADLYITDYNYTRTTYTETAAGERSESILEGQIFQTPYKEHVSVISPTESLWSEAYFEGSSKTVTSLLNTADGWVTQMTTRQHLYGYGENLVFSLAGQEQLNGRDVEVYTTEYTIDLAKERRLKEPLVACIKQTYYIDAENTTLTRIITDLTDLSQKAAISNEMALNGTSVQDAEQIVKGSLPQTVTETLDIFDHGNATLFEIPSH